MKTVSDWLNQHGAHQTPQNPSNLNFVLPENSATYSMMVFSLNLSRFETEASGSWLLYVTEISTVSKPSALQCKQTTLLIIYHCSILRRNDFRPEPVFRDANIAVGKTFYIGIHVHYPLQNTVLQRGFDKQEQVAFVHIYIFMKETQNLCSGSFIWRVQAHYHARVELKMIDK